MSTGIEWTEKTWNWVVGCTKAGPECANCYAIPMAGRLEAIAIAAEKTGKNPGRTAHYKGLTVKKGDRRDWSGEVRFVPEALEFPFTWHQPCLVFADSMSDAFHESVPFEWLDQACAVMALTPQHTYQILTKRPDQMLAYFQSRIEDPLPFRAAIARAHYASMRPAQDARRATLSKTATFPLPNVWLGTSVGTQKAADERIPILAQVPAAVRFLSCEPLLEKIDLKLGDHAGAIHWIIAGGESGHGARGTMISDLTAIVQQCHTHGVKCFVKQLGKLPYQDLDGIVSNYPISDQKGKIMREWPEALRVREWPEGGHLANF